MSLVLEQIALRARQTPHATAVRSGAVSLDYARLQTDLECIAHRLEHNRVGTLGVYLDNGIEWIVVDLAAIAAGVRLVPLPWFFSDEQLRHAVASGGVDHIVASAGLPAGIAAAGPSGELYRQARLQPVLSLFGAAVGASHGGKISYTSGTTGQPRGVVLEQAFIERNAAAIAETIPHRALGVHLGILPYSTLLENIAGVYLPLMLGKTVYAEPAECIGLSPSLGIDPQRLQREFNRVQPSSLILTPQLLELFCRLAECRTIDPACLGFVAVGGARCAEAQLSCARAAGIPVYEGYGLTEFGSVATLNTPQRDRLGSVGQALPGVTVSLAGDGEICLETRFDDPDGGQCTVRVNTGDYGRIDDDGFVYVDGRKSNLIVLPNGRNVSPEWVESVLEASPLIAQSCVYADAGGGLSALLLPADSRLAVRELDDEIERVNRALPSYARVGGWIRLAQPFSTRNQMLTANGRLRRTHIAALLAPSATLKPAMAGVPTYIDSKESNPC